MFYFRLLMCSLTPIALAGSISILSSQNEGKIYGGEITEPFEYPFMAVLFVITDIDDFTCGGVLISNQHILTSAQCVYGSEFIRSSIGMYNYLDEDQRIDTIYLDEEILTYLTVHEDFDRSTHANNIAILKLKAAVEFIESVQSIQLAPGSYTPNTLRETEAIIIGWGRSEEPMFAYPRHANVTILPPALCRHYYPTINLSMEFCSDGEFEKGACDYDAGGPVIQTTLSGDQLLIGIISFFGPVGCDSGWPTAYVSVAAYLDWINEHILVQT